MPVGCSNEVVMKNKISLLILLSLFCFAGCKNITQILNTYSVVFEKNGGTGTMKPQTFKSDEEKNLLQNGFTAPEGCYFKGWAESPEGEVVYSDSQKIRIQENIILYAVWDFSDKLGLPFLQKNVILYDGFNSDKTALTTTETWSLYFPKVYENGNPKDEYAEDLPYVDLSEVNFYYSGNYTQLFSDGEFKICLESDPTAFVIFNFKKNTIYFENYSALILRMPCNPGGSEEHYFKTLSPSYVRPGKNLLINLNDYHITLIHENSDYYIPLQLLCDIFCNRYCFNGDALFVNYSNDDFYDSSILKNTYYAGAKARSKSLIDFNYNELCFFMDLKYGLKKEYNITSFDKYLTDIGLKNLIKSNDSKTSSVAVEKLFSYFICDGHNAFNGVSRYCGFIDGDIHDRTVPNGPGFMQRFYADEYYEKLRKESSSSYFDDDGNVVSKIQIVTETGATGTPAKYLFVTLPSLYSSLTDLYSVKNDTAFWADESNWSDDSLSIIFKAQKILNENTDISGVVVDLSYCGGGYEIVAIAVSAWLTGTGDSFTRSTVDDAESGYSYQFDANLDGLFDVTTDSLADSNRNYKIYVLSSPVTFSAGENISQSIKNSDKALLIGQKSGGGTCTVEKGSTADGVTFSYSFFTQFGIYRNNRFISNDNGTEPDLYIDPTKFYDRGKLIHILEERCK